MLRYQNPAAANTVLEAITQIVSAETTAIDIAVAYVTVEGARTLVRALAAQMGESWQEIPKGLVTCFDFGLTEPAALGYLQEQGFEVRIANLGVAGALRLAPNPSCFHPKLYLAPTREVVRAVVGSANLSRRALSVNTEVVAVIELPGDGAVLTMWEELVTSSIQLTQALLQSYEHARAARRIAPPPDERPVPVFHDNESCPVFRLAVESGMVDPTQYQAFWVEVGYASGGAASQLELPRRSQLFFGFDFVDYDDEHHVIGNPTLVVGQHSWSRPLTWHGNNQMERVNLPTPAQSGLIYSNRTVLFQRAGNVFKLAVADVTSSKAMRWRDESAAGGTLFRVSDRSERLCGLI